MGRKPLMCDAEPWSAAWNHGNVPLISHPLEDESDSVMAFFKDSIERDGKDYAASARHHAIDSVAVRTRRDCPCDAIKYSIWEHLNRSLT